MTLSEELSWRGFLNQTTYKDIAIVDHAPITFYWGVDPSAASMTVGNLAIAMMVKHFISHGHKAVLLVGGATGLIGDPDGKAEERTLKSLEEITRNKVSIGAQYKQLFEGQDFAIVDNYDWFKDMGFLQFLRDVGKHVPMRQMLAREFVQTRVSEEGGGISYAEFSYSLIQGYDFLHLKREHDVSLQVCGSDQWGNCIAGVELIRRIDGAEAHVWSAPLVVNKTTGKKFGKSEDGAVWLDPAKTSPTQFYQFWATCDDAGVEGYLKIYTMLNTDEIAEIMVQQHDRPAERIAQTRLAQEVTKLVHGEEATRKAQQVTEVLTGKRTLGDVGDDQTMEEIRKQIPSVIVARDALVIDVLVEAGLATSKTDARRLINDHAITVNGKKIVTERFDDSDFQNNRLLIRKGKAFKDSALVELAS